MATPDTVTAWFTEYQKNHIVKDGVMPKWFHGFTSRKQAEELLMTKPSGYFLIRVSESRIGYTLSYRAMDICRHFMIDILPGNQCEIVGENYRHCSLHDLVAFHSRTPISPYTELLTIACDQEAQNISEDMPPALPERHPPLPNQNLSMSSGASTSPPSLYPNLSALNLHSAVSHSNHSPQPSLTLLDITTRWQSKHITTRGNQSIGLLTPCNQRHTEEQKSQADSKHARISLIQCKKIFKKKKNHEEEHTYMEINKEKVTTDPTTMQIPTNKDNQQMDTVSGTLPLEYLNPPPFAPGY